MEGPERVVCCTLCLCMAVAVFSSVALVYLTALVYMPAKREINSGLSDTGRDSKLPKCFGSPQNDKSKPSFAT